jgi:hypothetical protein
MSIGSQPVERTCQDCCRPDGARLAQSKLGANQHNRSLSVADAAKVVEGIKFTRFLINIPALVPSTLSIPSIPSYGRKLVTA